MVKISEKILLYNFHDDEVIGKIQKICRKMNIICQILPVDCWNQKIGYLLGQRGFLPAKASDESEFVFEQEVLVLSHLKSKRLDQFLKTMKEESVPPIVYKAVVTPFNTLWTLRRLCETMQREHGAMMERKNNNG